MNTPPPFGFELINNRVEYLTGLLYDINIAIEGVYPVRKIADKILKYGQPEKRFEELKQEVSGMFSTLAANGANVAVSYAQTLSRKALETSDLHKSSEQILDNVAVFIGQNGHEFRSAVGELLTVLRRVEGGTNTYYRVISMIQEARKYRATQLYWISFFSNFKGPENEETVDQMLQQFVNTSQMDHRFDPDQIREIALYVYTEIERTRVYLDELVGLYVQPMVTAGPIEPTPDEIERVLSIYLLQEHGLFPDEGGTKAGFERYITALTGIKDIKGKKLFNRAESIWTEKRHGIERQQLAPWRKNLLKVQGYFADLGQTEIVAAIKNRLDELADN